MRLEQAFDVAAAVDDVWREFHNIEAVIACLPGAALTGVPAGSKLPLSMTVKLGPMTAIFAGDGEILFDEPMCSGSISGTAIDRKSGSRIKGSVNFALSAVDAAAADTHVALSIDYAMGGALAQFSREGIVRDLAQRLTDAFAINLRRQLDVRRSHTASIDVAGTPCAARCNGNEALGQEVKTGRDDGPATLGATRATAGFTAGVTPETAIIERPIPAEQPAVPGAQRDAQAASVSLDVGALLWATLVARLRRWLRLRPR